MTLAGSPGERAECTVREDSQGRGKWDPLQGSHYLFFLHLEDVPGWSCVGLEQAELSERQGG